MVFWKAILVYHLCCLPWNSLTLISITLSFCLFICPAVQRMPALFMLTHHSRTREGGKRGCDQVKNCASQGEWESPSAPVLPHGATSSVEWSLQEDSQTPTERDFPTHHYLLWNSTETCLVALRHCLWWKNENVIHYNYYSWHSSQ